MSLYKKLAKFENISFDIFDTLIERKVKIASDLFKLIGKNVLGVNNAQDFYLRRLAAERTAETQAKLKGEIADIYDIYNCINGYEEQKKLLLDEEIRIEIECCFAKRKIKRIYDRLVLEGKTIYIVSDMYLPKEIIIQMLNKCGYICNKVYVSNEYNCDKLSGSLFNIVLNENGLTAEQIIHVGDSLTADKRGANRVGIKSVLIRKKNRLRAKLRALLVGGKYNESSSS